ncbi:MAG: hypothetical protein ACE5HA_17340 [Anaerolineae bacterium]
MEVDLLQRIGSLVVEIGHPPHGAGEHARRAPAQLLVVGRRAPVIAWRLARVVGLLQFQRLIVQRDDGNVRGERIDEPGWRILRAILDLG